MANPITTTPYRVRQAGFARYGVHRLLVLALRAAIIAGLGLLLVSLRLARAARHHPVPTTPTSQPPGWSSRLAMHAAIPRHLV